VRSHIYFLAPLHPWFHDIKNKPPIPEAYTVIFAEQPGFHSVDTSEDEWLSKIDAQMNISLV